MGEEILGLGAYGKELSADGNLVGPAYEPFDDPVTGERLFRVVERPLPLICSLCGDQQGDPFPEGDPCQFKMPEGPSCEGRYIKVDCNETVAALLVDLAKERSRLQRVLGLIEGMYEGMCAYVKTRHNLSDMSLHQHIGARDCLAMLLKDLKREVS